MIANMSDQRNPELRPAKVATLADALRERVRSHPERTAVVHGDATLTYQELADHSSALAARLGRAGTGPEECVGLFVEPSLDLMVGVWGILSAGGAYLPLSPEYPEDRLRYIIENAGAKVIVCQGDLTERLTQLAPQGTTVIPLGGPDEGPAGFTAPADIGSLLRPDNLAYVIYTSGSTGKPKGVMVEHSSVINQLRWLYNAGHLTEHSVVMQKTPMSFDAAQWELLAPVCGSMVVMGPPGVYRDPDRLMEVIRTHRVNTLQCVPTLLQALVDSEELHSCSSLRTVFSGGEALPKALVREFLDVLPHCTLVNLYGPTECTINASSYVIAPARLDEAPDVIPIGTPVDNTAFHILDDAFRPVPPGENGELYISGVQVARGYHHQPELTAERFVRVDLGAGEERLYRTGDLASWNPDGTAQFAGRTDNQVKLRGYRVELDEIARNIEHHDWVKRAVVLVKEEPRTGFKNLVACISLNPKEAALMDQGAHGSHHQSKSSKLQVKAQLSNPGVRGQEQLAGKPAVELPGREPTAQQRQEVFARKTYRFYEGGPVSRADVLALLGRRPATPLPEVPDGTGTPDGLSLAGLGAILRPFGQFQSEERLLPKYGYASPGALYATQLFVETGGMPGLPAGCYYYHPVEHRLIRHRDATGIPAASGADAGLKVHFIGHRQAIEPVYKNNIKEVLELETGHMAGLFDELLPRYGLALGAAEFRPVVVEGLETAEDDYYLGSFAITRASEQDREWYQRYSDQTLELYVQAHPGMVTDLPAGQYRYEDGELELISEDLVLRKHVIAINQQVYERSSIGVTAVSRAPEPWLRYIQLGRALHRLQANDIGLGLMSSGYSSESGNPLPAAQRIDAILATRGIEPAPSYFAIGGKVSQEQLADTGMREDAVHMRGPTEMIRQDLITTLPDYMVPNKVVVLDDLPVTANGKIDTKALAASDAVSARLVDRPFIPPRTVTERKVAELWAKALKYDHVSKVDDFFESDGDSIIAVTLLRMLNRAFGIELPTQVLFAHPTVEQLAQHIDGAYDTPASRLVRLHDKGAQSPVYCWPGLGGYPMNLRMLAERADVDRPFYGVQAYGLNARETPYPTIGEMAAEDIREIREIQPTGPYTLWGYSFGARVAFEAAYQLEQSGERVRHLCLIAPGSPKVRAEEGKVYGQEASYQNPAYVSILFSVFAGGLHHPALPECLETVQDQQGFVAFIGRHFPDIDSEMAERIVNIVAETFEFSYSFHELSQRKVNAPVTILKASGDDYSFLENATGFSSTDPSVIELVGDHYGLLREEGIEELTEHIRTHSRKEDRL